MTSRDDNPQSAIVLAGGRSSRMGASKAALRFGESTMLARIAAELDKRFGDIVIVAAPADAEPSLAVKGCVTLLHDDLAFEGPVLALARGLEAARAGAAFACACDLPMLDARVAAALLAMLPGYGAVIPLVGDRLQPLHAAYARETAGALRAMHARGEARLSAIAGAVATRLIGEDELRAVDPELKSFINVNTPADYSRALRLAR